MIELIFETFKDPTLSEIKIPKNISINYRLSPTFMPYLCERLSYIQTSSFHQSIAHSFVTLETKFNDVITASVTCKKLAHVIYQLSATCTFPYIYYLPVPKLCSITLVGFNGSLRYFCRILRILYQVSYVVLGLLYRHDIAGICILRNLESNNLLMASWYS